MAGNGSAEASLEFSVSLTRHRAFRLEAVPVAAGTAGTTRHLSVRLVKHLRRVKLQEPSAAPSQVRNTSDQISEITTVHWRQTKFALSSAKISNSEA